MLERRSGGVKPGPDRVDAQPERNGTTRTLGFTIGTDKQTDGRDSSRTRRSDRPQSIDRHPANRQHRHPHGANNPHQALNSEQHRRRL